MLMFGFGKGKIDIQMNKFNFSPGETIEGTMTLKLKKSQQARGVFIRLLGTQRIRSGYGSRSSTRYETVFDFKQPLDGEKAYPGGNQPMMYQFKIKIPESILNKNAPQMEGALGQVAKFATMIAGVRSKVTWRMIGYIDIPMGIDVSKKVQINIA